MVGIRSITLSLDRESTYVRTICRKNNRYFFNGRVTQTNQRARKFLLVPTYVEHLYVRSYVCTDWRRIKPAMALTIPSYIDLQQLCQGCSNIRESINIDYSFNQK